MASESELKYGLKAPLLGQKIIKSELLNQISVPKSRKTVKMKAIYYDDSKGTLFSNKIGYRVRQENEKYFATVKTPDAQTDAGFSRRKEYNIEVFGENPDPKIFCSVIEDAHVCEILRSLEPAQLFTTDFTRELLLVKYKSSVIEVAFDEGKIYRPVALNENKALENQNFLPICELECELKEGSESELTDFGKMLATSFDLLPLNDSKLKRGMSLISR